MQFSERRTAFLIGNTPAHRVSPVIRQAQNDVAEGPHLDFEGAEDICAASTAVPSPELSWESPPVGLNADSSWRIPSLELPGVPDEDDTDELEFFCSGLEEVQCSVPPSSTKYRDISSQKLCALNANQTNAIPPGLLKGPLHVPSALNFWGWPYLAWQRMMPHSMPTVPSWAVPAGCAATGDWAAAIAPKPKNVYQGPLSIRLGPNGVSYCAATGWPEEMWAEAERQSACHSRKDRQRPRQGRSCSPAPGLVFELTPGCERGRRSHL